MKKKPAKWTDVYQNDDEQNFFIALARHPKWNWRSTASIAKESGLSKEKTEELIIKYYKKGMVFQNPANEDQFGYWQRVPEMLPKDEGSITEKDHLDRIK